jgi:hypothetical protein
MLRLEKVFREERLMRGLTGLNFVEFEALLPTFERILQEIQRSKARRRAVGGGCRGILSDAKLKLFYILFYMKAYPTFDVAAFIFGTVRSVTFEWKSKLLPVLERALGRVITLPQRQIRSVEEFLRLFPEVKDRHGMSGPETSKIKWFTSQIFWKKEKTHSQKPHNLRRKRTNLVCVAQQRRSNS